MIRIKDTLALGAFAGIIATIPQLIFDYLSVQLGFSKYYAFQISGSIYLVKELTDDFLGLVLGGLVWEATGMLLGVLTVLLMRSIGKDYWWLKGIFVANAVMYTVIYGFLFNLGGARIVPTDIPTNLTVFIGNIIFGVTLGYLIVRWGDEELLKK